MSNVIAAKIADVGPPEKIYDSKSCDTLMYFHFVIELEEKSLSDLTS